jgi:cephalosporin hydroxylase
MTTKFDLANSADAIAAMQADPELRRARQAMLRAMVKHRYSYNFTWYGRPIIQFPDDVLALQELLFRVRPEVVVETGIAHGGSVALSASVLELLGRGKVVAVDIDIRPHNRAAMDRHPLRHRFELIQGSSVDERVAKEVASRAAGKKPVLVILDSNHTHEHVARELELYSPLVGKDSYLVVLDTVIEDLDAGSYPDRPWGKGNNPKTAVHEFLKRNDRFEIDKELEDRLFFTVAPDGFLKCVKDPA